MKRRCTKAAAPMTIPGNTTVMMAGNGKYKKVKYTDQKGYLLNPNYATKTVVKKTKPVK